MNTTYDNLPDDHLDFEDADFQRRLEVARATYEATLFDEWRERYAEDGSTTIG